MAPVDRRVIRYFALSVMLAFLVGMATNRFDERRILARLQHPNFAAILDGGTTE